VKEFLKGYFWPLVFCAIGLATFPFVSEWDYRRGAHDPGGASIVFTVLLTVGGTVLLYLRWRDRAPQRMKGAIAGLITLPVVLIVVALVWLKIGHVQLGPR
jgi:hypothetical protein